MRRDNSSFRVYISGVFYPPLISTYYSYAFFFFKGKNSLLQLQSSLAVLSSFLEDSRRTVRSCSVPSAPGLDDSLYSARPMPSVLVLHLLICLFVPRPSGMRGVLTAPTSAVPW